MYCIVNDDAIKVLSHFVNYSYTVTPNELFPLEVKENCTWNWQKVKKNFANTFNNKLKLILRKHTTEYDLRINEAVYIQLHRPSLNNQVKHVNLKLSL